MNRRLLGVTFGGLLMAGGLMVAVAPIAGAHTHCGTPQAEPDCPSTTLPTEAHPSIPAPTTTAAKPTTTHATTTVPHATTAPTLPPTPPPLPSTPPTTSCDNVNSPIHLPAGTPCPNVNTPITGPGTPTTLPPTPPTTVDESQVKDTQVTPTTVYLAPPLTLVRVDRPSVTPVTSQPVTGGDSWRLAGLACLVLGLGVVAYNMRPRPQEA